jgi:hypothetical protein
VSVIDVEKAGTFVDETLVPIANVTKDPAERQAIAHLHLDPADLLALQRRMLTGLLSKVRDLELLESRVADVRRRLYELYEGMVGPEDYLDEQDKIAHFEAKLDEARDTAGTLASELESAAWRAP